MASVRLRDSFGLKYLTEFYAISLNFSISEHITGHLYINDSIIGIPKPSSNEGNTKASAFLYKSINKLSFPLICFTEFFSIPSRFISLSS